MAKIAPDSMAARLAAMEAAMAALQAENAALKTRSAGTPGWHVRAIKPPKPEQLAKGSKPGRFHADRVTSSGLTVSYYVGGNGKLTIGGTFGTRGVTLWAGDAEAYAAYAADRGPDGMAADLARVKAVPGAWTAGIGG